MKLWIQCYKMLGNDRSRKLVVIAETPQVGITKIRAYLEKTYGPHGFTLLRGLCGPFDDETIQTQTGYGRGPVDVMLPSDREQYEMYLAEQRIIRDESREREKKEKQREAKLREIRTGRQFGVGVAVGIQ